ncbi:putative phosphodiesterase [Rhodobium gokarnense]|uniref:Phosphodiesterase n=1 Tax=Rhodobium gokarnense TaxID=364296 RepID=A0ABT3H8T4_9HYPH|nr:putative phosphodiesterase [Rhodobium gokarnense]
MPKTEPERQQYFSFWKPTSYDDQPLLAAADFIQEFSNELDLLFILGDVATTGLDEDLEVAKQVFLENRVREHLNAALEPRFGGLGVRICVMPGNHDRYKDDLGTPGCKSFDRVFGKIYEPRRGVFLTDVDRDGVSLCIISADFCFAEDSDPGLLRRYGRGAVDDQVLAELDNQTRNYQYANPGTPVVWALHFSPAEGVPSTLVLEEREKVNNLAKYLGVNHIFCGHTHFRKREIGTHPHIYCAGSVSSIDSVDNHFLHVCTVSKGSSGTLQLEVFDLKYDEIQDQFVSYPVSLEA